MQERTPSPLFEARLGVDSETWVFVMLSFLVVIECSSSSPSTGKFNDDSLLDMVRSPTSLASSVVSHSSAPNRDSQSTESLSKEWHLGEWSATLLFSTRSSSSLWPKDVRVTNKWDYEISPVCIMSRKRQERGKKNLASAVVFKVFDSNWDEALD